MSKKNFYIILALIHLAYFLSSIFYFNVHFGDYHEYLNQAENIKSHGDWYAKEHTEPFNLSYFTRRPPLYASFIFLGKTIVSSDYVISFLQSVLSFITILGIVKMLSQYNLKINYYKVILILLILYPSQLIYTNVIMSEIILQVFIFWTVYYFFKFLKTNSFSGLVLNNIFIAGGAFTKPVFYLFWIVNLLFILVIIYKKKLSFKFVTPVLIPVLVINILSFINYKQTGYYHFSSLPHDNVYDLTATHVIEMTQGDKAQTIIESQLSHFDSLSTLKQKLDEKEVVAKDIIWKNKTAYGIHYIKGFPIFFLDPGRYDLANYFKFEGTSDLQRTNMKEGASGLLSKLLAQNPLLLFLMGIVLFVNVLFTVSFFYFIFNKKIDIYFRMYITCTIFYIVALSAYVAAMRHKVPLIPLFIFTAVLFLDNIISKRKIKNHNA